MWGVVSEEEHRSRFWTSPTYSSFKIEIAPNFTAWKVYIFGVFPLRKILKFHLIFWCGRFVGKSPKTLPKLCVSTKFSHQGIRWNFGFLRSFSGPLIPAFGLNTDIYCKSPYSVQILEYQYCSSTLHWTRGTGIIDLLFMV